MSERSFRALMLALFAVAGLAAFAPILRVGFIGDDWQFLDIVSKAPSPLVVFTPLIGRFTRPLATLTFYVNYHVFGVWPLPAHLFVVMLHVLDAWLVCLLALRIVPPPNRLIAGGAGLVFLLFAGHTEAVSWVAGMADVAVVPFLIAPLLLFGRALEEARPSRLMVLAWMLALGGFLAKETAMVFPALALAYGVLGVGSSTPYRQRVLRTVVFVGGAGVLAIGYLGFRVLRFGSAFGAYSGLGISRGSVVGVARAFLLRAFLPAGRWTIGLWVRHLDLVLLLAGLAAIAALMIRDRRTRPGLAFAGAGLLLTLGPVLPLSISLSDTLSERHVYVATVFSSILTVWILAGVLRDRRLVAVAIAIVAALNYLGLERSNRGWIDGEALFRSVVNGVVSLHRDHAQPSTILLLNMPDTLDRPYVDGAGVLPALRLMPRGIPEPEARVRIAAMHRAESGNGAVIVSRSGRRFDVDLGRDVLVNDWLQSTSEYSVVLREPHRFAVVVQPMTRHGLVAYTTQGRVRLAAELDGIPFGFIDTPAEGAACAGATIRFSGWALDDEGVERVSLAREPLAGDHQSRALVPIGAATWISGTRPDVAAGFRDYPDAARAEWDYDLPCAVIRAAARPVRVHAIARDRQGQEVDLGARTIR